MEFSREEECLRVGTQTSESVDSAAFDAVDHVEAAAVHDLCGLRGPWRNRSESRDHDQFDGVRRPIVVFRFRPVEQEGVQDTPLFSIEVTRAFDQIDELGLQILERRSRDSESLEQAPSPRIGEGGATAPAGHRKLRNLRKQQSLRDLRVGRSRCDAACSLGDRGEASSALRPVEHIAFPFGMGDDARTCSDMKESGDRAS
jgi:hypothetical protein